MATKLNTRKLCLLLFLTLCFLLIINPCHCYKEFEQEEGEGEEETSAEEELFECFVKCDRNERELSKCEEKCVKSYQEKKKEEREQRGGGGGGGGGGGSIEDNHHHDPVQDYKQCQSRCGIQEFGEQRQLCQQKCQLQYEERKRERSKEHGGGSGATNPRKEQETENNPYFFDSQRFDSKYKTEQGHIKVLERFSKRSELLRGIKNYRLAILEANPNTFIVPHHKDAESVFVVLGGKGTISYVWQNHRQSFKLKHGDVMRVPAGSIVYLINRDNDERLYILELLQPVNTPGRFKEYFGVGGGNPESYYRAFSNEILEAAFNVPRERFENLFGQQQKGVIIKASKQQIKALTKESKSSKERKEESWGPFNLLDERPLFASRYGMFYEADPSNYDQLKDLDVSVAFMNIKKGGMIAPYYNSKSTRMVFVVGGSGQFEMACPHISSQSQGKKQRQETRSDVHYEKVSARLSVGDAFIIPAGHPISIISSKDSKLQLAGFGIKASFNQKYFLAGKENVWNNVESEAKELSFGLPASEVEEIFRSQEESYFLPGQQDEEIKEHSVASILDFVGF